MVSSKNTKQKGMRNRRWGFLATLLLLTVFLFSAAAPALPARADQETEDRIKKREKQVEDAKKQRKELEGSVTDLKNVISELEQTKADLNMYVERLDADLAVIQKNIDNIKEQILQKEYDIELTRKELEEAEDRQQAQYEAMKKRVRFMYEKGDTVFLEVLTGEGTFGEKLNKAHYIEKLSEYDRNMLEEFMAQVELVRLTKEALEEENRTLLAAKEDLEVEERNMENLITEKVKQIYGLSEDIQTKEEAIAAYEKSILAQNSDIEALERAIAADRAKLEEEQRQRYDGGVFSWPAPASYTITSDYGYRIHPIFGTKKFHNGIDIGAASGTAIVAAYNGTVAAAAYSPSMGNYVMIDHGDGVITIYMHASSLGVSTGAKVSAGQQIATVGSTGNSTGPHLHFSVRVNGSYVSPWQYLGH